MEMKISLEHDRLITMLKESIVLLCKSALEFKSEMNIDGLLGITLDKQDVVLVSIQQSLQPSASKDNVDTKEKPRVLVKVKRKRWDESSDSTKNTQSENKEQRLSTTPTAYCWQDEKKTVSQESITDNGKCHHIAIYFSDSVIYVWMPYGRNVVKCFEDYCFIT